MSVQSRPSSVQSADMKLTLDQSPDAQGKDGQLNDHLCDECSHEPRLIALASQGTPHKWVIGVEEEVVEHGSERGWDNVSG